MAGESAGAEAAASWALYIWAADDIVPGRTWLALLAIPAVLIVMLSSLRPHVNASSTGNDRSSPAAHTTPGPTSCTAPNRARRDWRVTLTAASFYAIPAMAVNIILTDHDVHLGLRLINSAAIVYAGAVLAHRRGRR